ncbi:MAG: phosphoribosyltransferase [Candidatus Bathyarchaeota archaeon]|nr:MAG: phosphoribosyltransferase [Candidatus Bathyarchaeota archaeon]
MEQSEKFEIPTWEEIYAMLLDLGDRIKGDKYSPDIIVGVSRGGWTPARILSDLLENPEIANIKAEFYLGVSERKKYPIITQSVSANVKGKKVLAVDDVSDTGKSLQLVRTHLIRRDPKILKIATLYMKPWSITKPDYYEKMTRSWIIFPWERKEALRKVVKQYQRKGKSTEDAKQVLMKYGFHRELINRFSKEI